MKRISTIGFQIPTNDDNYIKINSLSSLSDTDVAIFSPDLDYEEYGYSWENYQGKRLYGQESSAKIMKHRLHWNNEIVNFLQHGGTLFIMLREKKDFYIYTGEQNFSGTGRSRKTTNLVTHYSNYDFLPSLGFNFFAASGKSIIVNDPLVADLYKNFKDQMSFETYMKSDKDLGMTFTTKKKDRMLGTAVYYKKGRLMFIPTIDFETHDLVKTDPKTGNYDWNDKAEKLGKSFLSIIAEIDKAMLKKSESTPRPTWIQNSTFALEASKTTVEKIKKNKVEIAKRTKENDELAELYFEQERLKDLLFETGKNLEAAVTLALTILGFKAENYDDGELELDQIITSPEGHRFIGECEGKDSKDIDVSKFRQLLDGLNADFEKETVGEKAYGILFGNPQRLTDPNERTLSFTAKCQSGAKRESISLIKTADLFQVCRYISENNDSEFAKICRDVIVAHLGAIVNFPKVPNSH